MIFTKNKAQVSIFIIIGIIVVLGGIFLFSQSESPIPFFEDQSPGYKTTLSIEEFTTACIDERVRDGIRLLGLQGGWIHPEERGIISEFRDHEYLIERAQGFSFLGKTPLLYWDYYDDTTETFEQRIPSYDDDSDINSMKNQLEIYVEETLNEKCLQNYVQFRDVAEVVVDYNELEISSRFRDDTIEYDVVLPLEINHENIDKVDYLRSYSIETENKLRVPYYLARDITNTQSINSLFEKNILSTLVAYQSTEDTSLLPPFADTTTSYDVRVWNLDETQRLVQMILENSISYTQFRETNEKPMNIPSELQDLPLAQGLQQTYLQNYFGDERQYSVLPEGEKGQYFREYEEMSVTPTYNLLYPISFTIENGYGDFLYMSEPQMLLPFPVQVATTDYQAAYKLTAPIVLEIKDSRADPNDNFVFNLPLEVNIRHNAPLRENYEIDLSTVDFSNEQIGSSLVCNPSQYKSEPYTINITDSVKYGLTGERGVEDALVEFSCNLGVATCTLGTTQIVDNQTYLSFRLPENCLPGELKISKFGHQTIETTVDSNGGDFGVVDMPSSKELKMRIGWVDIENIYNALGIGTQQGESGIIIFEHQEEESMTRVINFDHETTDFYEEAPTVELLPGTYSIQAFMFREDEDNYVGASEFEVCDGGALGSGIGEDCETYELPRFNLTTWITGQYVLDEFVITTQDLLENDYLAIPMLRSRMPQSYEELEAASEYSDKIEELSELREAFFCTQQDITERSCN